MCECVSEPSRSHCHETVGVFGLAWCATADAVIPVENIIVSNYEQVPQSFPLTFVMISLFLIRVP